MSEEEKAALKKEIEAAMSCLDHGELEEVAEDAGITIDAARNNVKLKNKRPNLRFLEKLFQRAAENKERLVNVRKRLKDIDVA